jgi:glyoxylase-like metal-dependent hydrolase (beta-lactamase superfamily II)
MTFTIEIEETGALRTNSYLVYDEQSKEAALFDVGGKIKKLLKIIEELQLSVKYIFCTHLHFDHAQGVGKVRDLFPEAQFAYHENEKAVLENSGAFARMFGFNPKSIGEADFYIKEGNVYNLGELELKSILAPGHTPGSICFYFEDSLLSGDVLFYQGVGRTDLYGGSYETLLVSLSKLYKLPEETKVYPGHGESTTIGAEKNDNPFFSIHDI